jgi:hypothetical protein
LGFTLIWFNLVKSPTASLHENAENTAVERRACPGGRNGGPRSPERGPCEGGGPFFHHLFPSSSHPIPEPETSAAHHARYFRTLSEEGCQEETRTVRAIFFRGQKWEIIIPINGNDMAEH